MIDGDHGKHKNVGTFRSSHMYKLLPKNKLNVPADECLPNLNTQTPFIFIVDEAYPLQKHILKPHSRIELNPEY